MLYSFVLGCIVLYIPDWGCILLRRHTWCNVRYKGILLRDMERQNCHMILFSIILGCNVIILGASAFILGAFVIILGVQFVIFC